MVSSACVKDKMLSCSWLPSSKQLKSNSNVIWNSEAKVGKVFTTWLEVTREILSSNGKAPSRVMLKTLMIGIFPAAYIQKSYVTQVNEHLCYIT